MRKVIFGFLCFCSVIESINILFMSNKLGIFGTILMLSMSLGMTYFFYHLATKDNRKPIHNQIKATVHGTFIPQTQFIIDIRQIWKICHLLLMNN